MTTRFINNKQIGKEKNSYIIGTSTAGWTSADCDYLCDGTDDQIEINRAIQTLPSTGGEIKILDGTYNITEEITVNKENVKISGNGKATNLKKAENSIFTKIINALKDNCVITSLTTDGGDSSDVVGICVSSGDNSIITANICNNGGIGIWAKDGRNTVITENICNNYKIYGIVISSHLPQKKKDVKRLFF